MVFDTSGNYINIPKLTQSQFNYSWKMVFDSPLYLQVQQIKKGRNSIIRGKWSLIIETWKEQGAINLEMSQFNYSWKMVFDRGC